MIHDVAGQFARDGLSDNVMLDGRWNPNNKTVLDLAFKLTEFYLGFLVDAYITNSLAAKNTLIKRCRLKETKVFNIYNGIDFITKRDYSYKDSPIEVITVANVSERKGYIEYLNIIKAIKNNLKSSLSSVQKYPLFFYCINHCLLLY